MRIAAFRRHPLALVGAAVLGLVTATCLIAPLFVPESAANRVDPSLFRAPPSLAHPFGNDDVGRDILWRTVYGGRISLAIGALSIALAMTTGVVLGSVSGYYGRWVDTLIMRLTDAMLSMPSLLLLIVLTRILGPSVPAIILVIGLLNWMQVTRIVRANFLSLKEQDFVLAARALGVLDRDIMFRHVLPNTLAPVVVAATLGIGHAIILEASASFLGLGVQPPTASWGSMLYRAQGLMVQAPWVAIFPGLMILVTVMAINFLGDGLRDALDPRSRR
ncbi:MAG TPA: ABC transporter permease [Chloroflexota bacterium]|jgi:peptide/nickel transport system permease protein|nr:ABC transporter permease [Chloroflexota bacterium]